MPDGEQFEYKIVRDSTEEKMNALGFKGWELVAVSPYGSAGCIDGHYSYFKRKKN
ncbi:MAG: DUF4177 domain-containing protein [Candidatus Nealsonbacteria bacterium]